MAELKPLTVADLNEMGENEERRQKKIKIAKCVRNVYEQLVIRASIGNKSYTVGPRINLPGIDIFDEVVNNLRILFPDSKFETDIRTQMIRISWGELMPQETRRVPSTACFRCGRTSHWVQDCFASTDVHGNELD
jgi:hypothetical protein